MKKSLVALIMAFALLIPTSALAAPKAGATCSKSGSTAMYAGKKFTCVKSGKKLVWNKGVTVSKPTPTPTPTQPTPTQPTPTPTQPTPTPTPTPTVVKSKTLAQPNYESQINKINELKIVVTLSVPSNAEGAFITSPQLGLEPYKAFGVKNAEGKAVIEVSFPKAFLEKSFELYYFSYSKTEESSCCTSTTTTLFGENSTDTYIAKPISTSVPSTPISPITDLAPIETCKAENAGHNTHFAVGFPMWPERAKLSGTLKIAIVAVDFPDLQDAGNPMEHFKEVLDLNKDFFEKMTNNKVKIEYISTNSYIRMPKSIYDYNLSGNLFEHTFDGNIYWKYVREAIAVTDSKIDFTGATSMFVLTPPATTIKMIGTFVAGALEPGQEMITNEGKIFNVMIRGNGKYPEDNWGWIHEFGHGLGMTDLRDVVDPAKQNSDDLGVFDLMNSLQMPELLIWERFTLGIINDDQIRCVTKNSPTTHWIVPVEELSNRTKGIVIPLSKTKAIIVESRRKLGYDTKMQSKTEGALVYTLDTTITYGQSPIKIVPRVGSTDIHWRTDSTLHVNDSVTVEGWKITVVESGEFGEVVKVEKIG
jgi:M6 family metalloprotease-like protein